MFRRFFLLVVLGFGTQFSQADEVTEFEVERKNDIVFASPDGVDLLLDLHMPKGAKNPPLVMFIHGGGWKNGNRKRCRMCWVAKYGYAVASVEYRMSQEAIFPAQIHDCKGALRWLRANQEKYGFNAGKVVVAGTSAGGHLSSLLGVSGDVKELEGSTAGNEDQSSRVQGIIDYFGPSDFLLRSEQNPAKTDVPSGSVYQLLGGAVKENKDAARLASPFFHVTKDDPPLLILHGENDKTVRLAQATHFEGAYQKLELPVILHVEKGKGHGWDLQPLEKKTILEFLRTNLR